jgi:Zn-dependent peptidase ImmA (M78 family)
MNVFGRRDLWAIEVNPLSGAPSEPDPAAAASWCAIRLWANGKNLTAHTRKESSTMEDALMWPAAYLARWFVRAWPGFWNRAGWPLPGPVVDAESACWMLDKHLAELGPDVSDDLLDRRDGFVASHSLLAAAAGGVMPHVYLMHEDATVHIVWGSRHLLSRPSDVVFHEPQGRVSVRADLFVDAIAEFLKWCSVTFGSSDPILARQISEWILRLDRPEAAEDRMFGYLHPWGVPSSSSAPSDIDPRLDLPTDWRSAGAFLNPGQFPAAVVFRSLSPVVSKDDVFALLTRLRAYPSYGGTELESLRSGLAVQAHEVPHHQGYALAEQLRRKLGNIDGLLDIDSLLGRAGVKIDEANLSDASADAATVWGAEHGPVVVLNTLGSKNVPWARRMTLAHEFCHLLIDRHAAAELMIASTPWAPPKLERRANAFAAELLLPKAGIQRVLGGAIATGWVDEQARTKLMDEFEVGATVCDHQLKNRFSIPQPF